jgi:hypothetical protein
MAETFPRMLSVLSVVPETPEIAGDSVDLAGVRCLSGLCPCCPLVVNDRDAFVFRAVVALAQDALLFEFGP